MKRDLAPGDLVRILPTPGRRDGFDATVRSVKPNRRGLLEVEVFGGRRGRAAVRTFYADRVRFVKAAS